MENLLSKLLSLVRSSRADEPALPVIRNSLQLHKMPGYHAPLLDDYPDPHAAIDHLRRVECGEVYSKWGAAPFSDEIIHTHETWKESAKSLQKLPCHVVSDEFPGLVHVPILSIVGISNFNNLGRASEIATFGDALFAALHGASLLFPSSLDYLCSDSVKYHLHPHFQEMPQKHRISSVCSKYKARGGIDFSRYGDGYIANDGKQRTLLAMYAIWQREGPNGMLRNVKLSGARDL
ncbi:hypothetical protein BTK96_000339 [Burkholderia pyrrocinia]|uniref:hypothetical protein n=1 Tax=Burkholderia sp. IT-111MI5 TaxID=3026439 RepID=UPI002A2E6B79|nr:hypothetical protein [Burkholderia pyrrocinia]EKS9893141.1 hypothetical protein [Burkholderia pyrrocinia]EKS9908915.1 hypothetical protein [Burkholderia pyrrocinia]